MVDDSSWIMGSWEEIVCLSENVDDKHWENVKKAEWKTKWKKDVFTSH